MTLDPDSRYHFTRVRQEALCALQADSMMVAMVHGELCARHAVRGGAAMWRLALDRRNAAPSDGVADV